MTNLIKKLSKTEFRTISKHEQTVTITSDYAELDLPRNLKTKIDIEDIDIVSAHRWSLSWNEWVENFYVNTKIDFGNGPKTVYIHRLIMGVDDPQQRVDHINGDTLDNRKSNLRVCTHAQNMENRPRGANKNNKTGVRNVYIHKCQPSGRMYVARIALRGKPICEYFPFTDEGFEQAQEAALRLREQHFTHSN